MPSVEIKLLRRPFAAYEELASEVDSAPFRTVVVRTSILLAVIAASVSLITAGRLTWRLLLGTAVAWAMVPILECIIVIATHALGRPGISRTRAIGLYMAGNAPLLLFLLACAGVCLFTPNVYAAFSFLLRTFIVPGLLVFAVVYGWVLSFAYYRAALGLSRSKSAVLLSVDIALKIGLVLGWYLAIDNIVPQLGWSQR